MKNRLGIDRFDLIHIPYGKSAGQLAIELTLPRSTVPPSKLYTGGDLVDCACALLDGRPNSLPLLISSITSPLNALKKCKYSEIFDAYTDSGCPIHFILRGHEVLNLQDVLFKHIALIPTQQSVKDLNVVECESLVIDGRLRTSKQDFQSFIVTLVTEVNAQRYYFLTSQKDIGSDHFRSCFDIIGETLPIDRVVIQSELPRYSYATTTQNLATIAEGLSNG